jgi:hypothetical protein
VPIASGSFGVYLKEMVPTAFTHATPAIGLALGLTLHLPLFSFGRIPACVTVAFVVPLIPL